MIEVSHDSAEPFPDTGRQLVERGQQIVRELFDDVLNIDSVPASAEWEEICVKNQYAAARITKGRAAGVPDVILRTFSQEFILENIKNCNFQVALNFMKNMGFGSEQEQATVAQLQQEWVVEMKRVRDAGVERQVGRMRLHSSSTMEHFMHSIRKLPLIEQQLAYEYLWDFCGGEDLRKLQTFKKEPVEGAGISVADFFGDDLVDMNASLPITWLTPEQWAIEKLAQQSEESQ